MPARLKIRRSPADHAYPRGLSDSPSPASDGLAQVRGGKFGPERAGFPPPAPRSCHPYRVATVYEAAGGIGGLRRLAEAWHTRVMADEEVSHAFSHGYRPDHSERLAAYWAEALGGQIGRASCRERV